MTAVYYSLVLTEGQATGYQNQWIRSIGSLRRYNQTVPVHLFLFNEPTQEILRKADEYHVIVHQLGQYRNCLRDLAGEEGAALSCIPTLHKLLPLGHFGASVSQVLFLDCDTFLFGNVDRLFEKYRQCRWYAREEAHSRGSVFLEYRPSHIDEDALSRIAIEAGSSPFPPYNSGVVMLNHGLAAELFGLRKEFLRYAWRLTLGAGSTAGLGIPQELGEIARAATLGQDGRIEFPSKNFWILEQIALWLTLGRIPGLSHGRFLMEDVLQNGEFMIYRSYRRKCTVVHYFRGNEALFLKDGDEEREPV